MAKLIAEGKATSEADAQALKPFADLDAKMGDKRAGQQQLGARGVQFSEAIGGSPARRGRALTNRGLDAEAMSALLQKRTSTSDAP